MTDASNATRDNRQKAGQNESLDKLRSLSDVRSLYESVGKQELEEIQQILTKEVQTRPLRSLGIAAAIGLCLGFIAGR